MTTFTVSVRGDRNRMGSRYPTREQAAAAVARLKRQGLDAWAAPLVGSDPRGSCIPRQLQLQFDLPKNYGPLTAAETMEDTK